MNSATSSSGSSIKPLPMNLRRDTHQGGNTCVELGNREIIDGGNRARNWI